MPIVLRVSKSTGAKGDVSKIYGFVPCAAPVRNAFPSRAAIILYLIPLPPLFSRLLLNIHELITIKEAMMCGKQGHHPFSVWSMVTISISHFLLVLNSATNILVYCLLSSKFREECSKILIRRKPLHTPQQCLLYVNKCCFWKPKDRSSTRAENGNNLLEQSKSKAQAI